jgi:hypothetical protein
MQIRKTDGTTLVSDNIPDQAALKEALLTKLGFRFGRNGTHAARTMMLDDLRQLLAHLPSQASRTEYVEAIIGDNILGKPTRKARELAFQHLANLYVLDPSSPIFRALLRLWPIDPLSQPVLALAAALARDPMLRCTQQFVLTLQPGSVVLRQSFEDVLGASHPDRFSPASLRSFAQNVAGTWTSAGLLQGRSKKSRAVLTARPAALVMLLFLGYLEGRSGQRLFSSNWVKLLDAPNEAMEACAVAAGAQGIIGFLSAGDVKEVRFPGYLSLDEEQIRQELSHVI